VYKIRDFGMNYSVTSYPWKALNYNTKNKEKGRCLDATRLEKV